LNQNYFVGARGYQIATILPALQPLWAAASRRVLVGGELVARKIPKDPSALNFIAAVDKYERAKLAGEPTEDLKKAIPEWMGLLEKIEAK
jgi:hypothetical protein